MVVIIVYVQCVLYLYPVECIRYVTIRIFGVHNGGISTRLVRLQGCLGCTMGVVIVEGLALGSTKYNTGERARAAKKILLNVTSYM